MGRCGNNIRKRKDGRWEARAVRGLPVNGKTNYKYLYGKSYDDVWQKKQEFLKELPACTISLPQGASVGLPMADDASVTRSETVHSTVGSTDRMETVDSAVASKGQTETVDGTVGSTGTDKNVKGEAASTLTEYSQPGATASAPSLPEAISSILARSAAAPTGPTLSQVCADWLNSKKPSVKESTFAYYATMEKNHIRPVLGKCCVEVLTAEALSEFLMNKKLCGRVTDSAPLSDKTVADLRAILKQILLHAQVCGLIAAAPPCPATPAKQPPIHVLAKAEQDKLEEYLRREDTPFSLGILISLYGGPRIGEVCALKWEDFDFDNETLRISKTVSRISDVEGTSGAKTRVVITKPKTDNSVRIIPLPTLIFAYLKERRQEGNIYILTGTEKCMEPRVCRARYKRLLRRAGLSSHTWHCLRHTFATRCVENGVDFKSLSELMGHSDVKITMQRYVHPSIDFKKEQVNKLPCFLAGGQ